MPAIPPSLRTLRALRLLNVPAVGLSLAACAAAAFGSLLGAGGTTVVIGLTTLPVATVWAALFRLRRTTAGSRIPIGWLLAAPLAALNAALSAGVLLSADEPLSPRTVERFIVGGLMGVIIGTIFWVPSLIVSIVVFGVPLAKARTLARNGLSGEERGERLVGTVSVATAVFAFIFAPPPERASFDLTRLLALLGAVTGATAALLAWAREARRRDFIARVEAGDEPGYRVVPTGEGAALMRVVSTGEGYRVADFEEPVADIRKGEVTRVVE